MAELQGRVGLLVDRPELSVVETKLEKDRPFARLGLPPAAEQVKPREVLRRHGVCRSDHGVLLLDRHGTDRISGPVLRTDRNTAVAVDMKAPLPRAGLSGIQRTAGAPLKDLGPVRGLGQLGSNERSPALVAAGAQKKR